jgi:glycosyltransferase involved in cell wall biosynthesis
MSAAHPSVTACIPYYGGKRYIRRAVESLLNQTHRDIEVIVVNDGDRDHPWDELTSFGDPRLICFNLTRNHGGPFFANAVVVNTVSSPWFLVQEQDDWSTPDRVERLLHLTATRRADAAVSAQYFHRQHADGTSTPVGVHWRHIGRSNCPVCRTDTRCQECFVDTGLTRHYRYRAPHAGLFRVSLLRQVGGYDTSLRLHYDSLLMNLLLMTGTIAHTPAPLYHRLLRPDSITHARHTGLGSRASNEERRLIAGLYGRAFTQYQRYLGGSLSSRGLTESIRRCCQTGVPATNRHELVLEVNRLRRWLVARRRRV